MKFVNKEPATLGNMIWLEMGKIAVSLGGQTNIWSPGFCDCMGVIAGNASGAGGLAAHVLGGGNKAKCHMEFFFEAATECVKIARNIWGSVHVVLTHGASNGGEYPHLVDILEQNYKVKVLDLRTKEHRSKGGQFFYNPTKQKVCIWEGDTIGFDEKFDPDGRIGAKKGTLELAYAKKGMPFYVFS